MPICMKTKLQKKALVNGPFGFFKKFHFSVIKFAIVQRTHMVLKHSWDKISFWNNENCINMHVFQYVQTSVMNYIWIFTGSTWPCLLVNIFQSWQHCHDKILTENRELACISHFLTKLLLHDSWDQRRTQCSNH